MALGDDTLAFRARALAQAHPLTAAADRLINQLVAVEVETQPMPEIGQWAATAMLTGYCLRAVEEQRAGVGPPGDVDVDRLEEEADRVIIALRSGTESMVTCGDPDELIDALDTVIASEIDRRADPWRTEVGEDAWRSLEDYLAHYTVKGYAIRTAESQIGIDR